LRHDPERAALESRLEELLEAPRETRRRFLGRGAAAALVASGLSAALSACGIEGAGQKAQAQLAAAAERVNHPKVPIGTWTFANWPLYIDEDTVKDFDRKFGGHCRYVEEINENGDFFGKVRQQLSRGTPIGRDIVVLTDYMAGRWVRSGYCTPIDKRNVPNGKNLVDNLKSIAWDPQRDYSLPWQSGAIGLGYDIKQTGREIRSAKELFNPEWKGRVTMLNEQYDSAGTTLIMQGKDPTKATIDDQLEAIETISKANDAGQFRRFTGNDYTTDLTKGNVAIALAYSGDLVQLRADNPNLRFSYPEEGAMLFTDNMLEPERLAHHYVNYISPVGGIREILERTSPEVASNDLIFPTDEIRRSFHAYPALTPTEEQRANEAMAKVTGG
jgi:spermidine/putrescine transport system substrate-binding protein